MPAFAHSERTTTNGQRPSEALEEELAQKEGQRIASLMSGMEPPSPRPEPISTLPNTDELRKPFAATESKERITGKPIPKAENAEPEPASADPSEASAWEALNQRFE